MAEEKQIIIDVELETKDFDKEIGNVNTQLEENRKQIRELKKDYSANSEEIASLERQNRELTQTKRALIKEQKTEANSLDALRLKLANLTKERNGLNTSSAEGAARFQELQKEIKNTSEEISNFEQEGGDFRRNVGNYPKLIDRARASFVKFNTALKASVIGLVVALLAKLAEAFSRNQKVQDAFNVAFEATNIIIADFVNFVVNNFGQVANFFKQVFEDPQKSISDLGEAIKANLIERFDSLLESAGFLADAFKKLFAGDFSGALEAAQEAGKEFIDVYTGVDNSLEKGIQLFEESVDSIKEYTSEVFDAAVANVELQKSLQLAQAEQQRLIQESERLAEQQRQIRDDENRAITDRIEANNRLLEILNTQEDQELALVDLAIRRAQSELDKNNNIENQVALIEAQTQRADILNRIEGQRSEQLVNQVALEKELRELTQSSQEAQIERSIQQQEFDSQFIDNQVQRLEFQRFIAQQEQELESQRLQSLIDSLTEGTQARIDAENEFLAKKQEFAQQDLIFTRQIEDAKTAARQNATDAAIGLALEIFNQGSAIGKAFALAQIAADTGRALSGALANANSPTPDNILTGGLAGIAKFLTLAGTIVANSKRAIAIVNSGNAQSASVAGGGSNIGLGSSVGTAGDNEGLSNVNPSLLSQFNNQAQQANNITVNSQVSVVDIIEATENRAAKVDESSLG